MFKDDLELHSFEPPQHVEAENCHPAKHREVGIDTKVAEKGARWMRNVRYFIFVLVDVVFVVPEVVVVDNEEVGGRQNGGSRAADEDLAMQVVEVGDPPVDKDCGQQADDADRAEPGVDILCHLVTRCCVPLFCDLVEDSLVVSNDRGETETEENENQASPSHPLLSPASVRAFVGILYRK